MVNIKRLAIKRIPLRPSEFNDLRIFKAKNGFKTYNNAIRFLLGEKQ